MKHFEIQYRVGNTCFVYKTTSASEAFLAMCDAVDADEGLTAEKRDDIFHDIAAMQDGRCLSMETGVFRVIYVDGEV